MPLKKKKGKKCKGNNCNKLIPKKNNRIINATNFGTSIQQSPGNNNDMLLNLVNVLNRGNETKFNDITQNLGLLTQNVGNNQRDITNRLTANQRDIGNRLTANQTDLSNRLTANQTDLMNKSDNIVNTLSANHREVIKKTVDEAKRLRDIYTGRTVQMREFISNKFDVLGEKLNETDMYNRENFTLIEPVLNRQSYPQGKPPTERDELQNKLMQNARNVLNSRLFKAGIYVGESAVSAASTLGTMASSDSSF